MNKNKINGVTDAKICCAVFCLEKITERLDEKHYRLQLMYNKSDETEMVIRILSFGPLLRVQEPAGFIELLRKRLQKQLALRAKE